MATTDKTSNINAVLKDLFAKAEVAKDFDLGKALAKEFPAPAMDKAAATKATEPFKTKRNAVQIANVIAVLVLGGKTIAQVNEKAKKIFDEGGWTGNATHLANPIAKAMVDGLKLDAAVAKVTADRTKAGTVAIAKAKGAAACRAIDEIIPALGLTDAKEIAALRAAVATIRKRMV